MRQEKEVVLPDWLDHDVWFDYVDHRRMLKAPMTRRAKVLAIGTLDNLRASEDPRFIVDRSIENGWKGLFPRREELETSTDKMAAQKGLSPKRGESQIAWENRVRTTR